MSRRCLLALLVGCLVVLVLEAPVALSALADDLRGAYPGVVQPEPPQLAGEPAASPSGLSTELSALALLDER